MKNKLYKLLVYLLKLILIVFVIALILFIILKFIFKVEDTAFIMLMGIGAVVVALSSTLAKSTRQRKMYDKHMESFYFEERKKNF